MNRITLAKGKLYRVYRNSKLLKGLYRGLCRAKVAIFGSVDRRFRSYSIELSSICNAKCVFCSYPAIAKSGKTLSNMTADTFRMVSSFIEKNPVKSISFTPITGEFFVNPDWNIFLQVILNMEKVEYVGIISNGIILTPRNIEKLVRLVNIGKIGLSISVGGLSRDEYREAYGVDEFRRVVRNVNLLLRTLKDMNAAVPVRVEFRLLDGAVFDEREALAVFNSCGYEFFDYGIVRRFDPLNNLLAGHKRLIFAPLIKSKQKACRTFSSVMFTASGEVRACGCVMSEIPGDETMHLGTVADDFDTIKGVMNEKINSWETENVVPLPCRTCTDYVARL